MATDGPKIVEGDLAHDTYWGIMDLYDGGEDIEAIREEYSIHSGYFDAFDYEIYITVCALAFWEIGALNDELLQETRRVIEKGAGVKIWTEEASPKEGKARKRALDRLWAKISTPNPRIRKRKKYREVKNFHFPENEILAFQLKDGNYRAVICIEIRQYRGVCSYWLVPTTYSGEEPPTPEMVMKKELLGRWIGSGYNKKKTSEMQEGISELWAAFPEQDNNFFGLAIKAVTHTNFHALKKHFRKAGILTIRESFKELGSLGYFDDFEEFERVFANLDEHCSTFRLEKMPVRLLAGPLQ